ncbi:MAG: NAD-dependent epimerase/dehydratase family protein [Candidatus Omnitrophota bacterium]
MFKGRNVLVAGGAGFTGANLVQRLVSLGANVRATLYKKNAIIQDKRIEYIRCDLRQMEDCTKVVKDMEYVFMCAANTSGAAVIKANPLAHVTPNLVMNAQMLEAAYFAKVKKFSFMSSSVVYPPSGSHPCKEDEMMNGDPADIYFLAAWMKRYTEISCRYFSQKINNPIGTAVIRPANIYGPHDNYDLATSHVMSAMIRKVVERQNPIQVWGTGEDVRDWIYVEDLIDGFLLATEKLNTYDPVNIALGKGYTIMQMLQILLELEDYRDAKIICDPSKPSMIPIRLFDTTKAEKLLGFKAKHDLREGLKKTIAWYKATHSVPAKSAAA